MPNAGDIWAFSRPKLRVVYTQPFHDQCCAWTAVALVTWLLALVRPLKTEPKEND